MPYIASLATALPPFRMDQATARTLARRHFRTGFDDTDRLLGVFDNSHVAARHFCVPPDWFTAEHTFEEKNREYVRWATQLGREAITRCLERANAAATDVDTFVFVSSSGLATPSIDAHLITELGLRSDTRRFPLFGLGCVGGAAGLGHAAQLARSQAGSTVLLLAIELNSITFQENDFSAGNLVASSLFADGAAAALVRSDHPGTEAFEVVDARSCLWPDSTDLMGWNFTSDGFQVVFSRRIPALVKRYFPANVDAILEGNAVTQSQLRHFLLHPGGARILDAYEDSLGLNGDSLQHSRHVLEQCGNMSSATVLFILERATRVSPPAAGDYALAAAFGPGFSSELLLLRWADRPAGSPAHRGPS